MVNSMASTICFVKIAILAYFRHTTEIPFAHTGVLVHTSCKCSFPFPAGLLRCK